MPKSIDIIVAIANPQLRTRLVAELHARGAAVHAVRDLEDLTRFLSAEAEDAPGSGYALALDEAFIYPHVYEECARIKVAARVSLTIVLLVEPRTRTRWDWNGVDEVLKLPATADDIAVRALRRWQRAQPRAGSARFL